MNKNKNHFLLFENTSQLNQLDTSLAMLGQSLNALNDLLKSMEQPPLTTEEISEAISSPDFLPDRILPAETTLFGLRIKREAARQMVQLPEQAEHFKTQAAQIKASLDSITMQAAPSMFRAVKGGIEPDPAQVEAARDAYRTYAANDQEKQLWDRAIQASKDLVGVARELGNDASWFFASGGSIGFDQQAFYQTLHRRRQIEKTL